ARADCRVPQDVRLRPSGARTLRRDAAPLRGVRPRHELPAPQGRVAADGREAAGVDQPRRVEFPDRLPGVDTAGHCQGGAPRQPLRPVDLARDSGGVRDSGLRARRRAAGAVRRRPVLAGLTSARAACVRLRPVVPGRQGPRLLLASRDAARVPDGAQLRRGHDADQEHLPRGDPQAVRPDGTGQGAVRAAGVLPARVSQCTDPAGDGLPGRLRRRVLHRLAAHRDAFLAGRARPAVVRGGHSPRLSGGARVAVRVLADRAADEARHRPRLHLGRPAREVRGRQLMASPRRSLSPGRRAWLRFRANRRGYWSLWIFAAVFVLSLFAEVLSNDRPIVAHYEGRLYWPLFSHYPETTFGGDFRTATDYLDPFIRD